VFSSERRDQKAKRAKAKAPRSLRIRQLPKVETPKSARDAINLDTMTTSVGSCTPNCGQRKAAAANRSRLVKQPWKIPMIRIADNY
jgi:hypothetical protein